MIHKEIVRIKVQGDFACFTRPDLKVERMTYPCMTPSAARGILDCILWKPEFQWYVRRVLILNPVQFFSVKRNEIKDKQGGNPILIEEKRAQRNSVVLKDVSYIIETSIHQYPFSDKNPPIKYVEMFERRVRKGQCWRRPYLGTREFSAEFTEPAGTEKPIADPIPLGRMLFDFFYDVVVKKGVLSCEVPENKKMMRSSHIRPPIDSEVSAVLYDFNEREEKEAAVRS